MSGIDIISQEEINKFLNHKNTFNIKVYGEVTSTNELIKQAAQNGAEEGLVIIAESQTKGTGRFARKFYSPENCGIYMTVLLRPSLPPENSVLITAAAAAACAKAIETLSGRKADIKWVNDILINSKKVCGILTIGEIGSNKEEFSWAAVGIGINAYTAKCGFAPEIADIAGSVFSERKNGLRSSLIAKVLDNFWDYYKNLSDKTFYPDYKSRICTIGKEIAIIKNNKFYKNARCTGLDENCRLEVSYENGETEYLSSGEISIREKNE